MARIVILGCAGAGKSTLGRKLSERTGAPFICLDEIWWRHGADAVAFRAEMTRLHADEAWVSDGNFAGATFDVRLPRATLVVWLDRPRAHCALRAVTRLFPKDAEHGLTRLPEVLRFIWNFERINRPRIEALRMRHAPDVPVLRLRGDRDLAAFLGSQP